MPAICEQQTKRRPLRRASNPSDLAKAMQVRFEEDELADFFDAFNPLDDAALLLERCEAETRANAA